ncbi:MAG TPA: thioredoxin [Saprospiraceae bacterium]|nr:thioredoxin [Saprospiraceae bacterium]
MKGNFNHIINGDLPVLVDFSAEWCGPCKAQTPIIKEVAKALKGKIRVIKIDVDKNPAISQRFQIRGVPTLGLFKKGELLWKQSGLQSKPQLINIVNQYI